MSTAKKRRRFAFCWNSYVRNQGILPPVPTLKSWKALRYLGKSFPVIDEIRLSYTDVGPTRTNLDGVTLTPEQAFAIDYANICAAGFDVNLNAGPQWMGADGVTVIKPDPADVKARAARMAKLYGGTIEVPPPPTGSGGGFTNIQQGVSIYTFGNEVGPQAKAWEEQNPGSSFVGDVYMPAFLAFVEGVLSVDPNALFGVSDADSVDIQGRIIAACKRLLPSEVFRRLRRRVHPYGQKGPGFNIADMRYATLGGDAENEGFATQADCLPLDIGEIGRAGTTGASKRRLNAYNASIAAGKSEVEAQRDGDLAALDESSDVPEQLLLLGQFLLFLEFVDAEYPFIGQIDILDMRYCFTSVPVILVWPPPDPPKDPPDTWSTWTYKKDSAEPEPIISDFGRALAAHITKVNGLKSGRPPGRRG